MMILQQLTVGILQVTQVKASQNFSVHIHIDHDISF